MAIIRTPSRASGGITAEERRLMDEHTKVWIKRAFRTEPIVPEKIVPAIKALYAAAGLTSPRVVIVPSPLVMAFAYGAAGAIWATRDAARAEKYAATYDATNAMRDTTQVATYAVTDLTTREATYDATQAATYAAYALRDATYAALHDAAHDATRAATHDAARAATYAVTDDATREATYDATQAATYAAMYVATETMAYDATQAATRNATLVATFDATNIALDFATHHSTYAATRNVIRDAVDDVTDMAVFDATQAVTRDATRAATYDATFAATYDATSAATDAATRDILAAEAFTAAYDATNAIHDAAHAATDDATSNGADGSTRGATFAATFAVMREELAAATYRATRTATLDVAHASGGARAATFDTNVEGARLACLSLGGAVGLRAASYWSSAYHGGNLWAPYECYLTAARDILGLRLPEHAKYKAWEEAAIEGGFRVLHSEFCIVCDFPDLLKTDEQGRPHNETGPSHRWRDGWGFYSWHGVRIPGNWIEHRETLTSAEVLKEQNLEVRRAGCDILGWSRILKDLKARVINRDVDPEIGEVIEVSLPDLDRPARFLRVRCGTGREFVCGLPPEINTALEGQAYMTGLSPKDFVIPEIRT
jgi:hypothetical protein